MAHLERNVEGALEKLQVQCDRIEDKMLHEEKEHEKQLQALKGQVRIRDGNVEARVYCH